MTRKRIKTLEDAQAKLEDLTLDVEIVEYGGTTTSRSKFYNTFTKHTFYTSLNDLCKRLQAGAAVESLGAKQKPKPKKRRHKKALELWLQENLPHIKLVHLDGDTYSKPARFYRVDTGTCHTLQPSRLKDKYRRGLTIFPTQEEIVKRRTKTRRAQGLNIIIPTRPESSLSELAEELGVSYSHFQSTLKTQGIDAALALTATSESVLETQVRMFLDSHNIEYQQNKKLLGTSYRPDFYLPAFSLVVECDGLYWHAEPFRNRTYHVHKKDSYIKLGITSLFFRGNELKNNLTVVQSMISHRCKLITQKFYARQLEVCIDPSVKSLLNSWHLMGPGQGRIYTLQKEGTVYAILQIRRYKDGHEVSRFCTKPFYSIPGGYSKLVAHAVREEQINKLYTYVDLRYGTGDYLQKLGYTQINTPKPSFQWTDGRNTWHRLAFKGDSGYVKGLTKIWDCGQALWVTTL